MKLSGTGSVQKLLVTTFWEFWKSSIALYFCKSKRFQRFMECFYYYFFWSFPSTGTNLYFIFLPHDRMNHDTVTHASPTRKGFFFAFFTATSHLCFLNCAPLFNVPFAIIFVIIFPPKHFPTVLIFPPFDLLMVVSDKFKFTMQPK